MNNFNNTIPTKRGAVHLKIICHSNCSGIHLFYCIIKTIPSNAELRKEQDDSKQTFVGGTMAES